MGTSEMLASTRLHGVSNRTVSQMIPYKTEHCKGERMSVIQKKREGSQYLPYSLI